MNAVDYETEIDKMKAKITALEIEKLDLSRKLTHKVFTIRCGGRVSVPMEWINTIGGKFSPMLDRFLDYYAPCAECCGTGWIGDEHCPKCHGEPWDNPLTLR